MTTLSRITLGRLSTGVASQPAAGLVDVHVGAAMQAVLSSASVEVQISSPLAANMSPEAITVSTNELIGVDVELSTIQVEIC